MTLGQRAGADAYVSGHGDLTFDVMHYDLRLGYAVRGNHLNGKATLAVRLREPASHVVLDLHSMHVTKVTVNGSPAKFSHKRGSLSLRLADELPCGHELEVTVAYSGNPHPVRKRHLGTAGWEELSDGVIVAGQPHGAPSWFPCNDRPSNKASYRVTVTADNDYQVIGNGELVEQKRGSRATTWVYEQREPMAPYLATLHVGKYDLIDLDDGPVPLRVAIPHRLRSKYKVAFGRQAAMMRSYIDQFGPYPFGSYTVVVTADDLDIPLESQGLSTFGANFLRSDWNAIRLVAHELSHQWFGNSLTVTSWKDIWLHEGFACYAEWLWSETSGVATAQERAEEHWEKLSKLDQDLVLGDPGPDLMFDDRVYKRGALLLHALRLTVGDGEFFDLLKSWVQDHRYGHIDTETFEQFVAGRAGNETGRLLNDWLREIELPPLPERS